MEKSILLTLTKSLLEEYKELNDPKKENMQHFVTFLENQSNKITSLNISGCLNGTLMCLFMSLRSLKVLEIPEITEGISAELEKNQAKVFDESTAIKKECLCVLKQIMAYLNSFQGTDILLYNELILNELYSTKNEMKELFDESDDDDLSQNVKVLISQFVNKFYSYVDMLIEWIKSQVDRVKATESANVQVEQYMGKFEEYAALKMNLITVEIKCCMMTRKANLPIEKFIGFAPV
jgi:hypothetical protein